MEAKKALIIKIRNLGIEYDEDVNLSQFSYLKTGGKSKLIVFPFSTQQVQSIIKLFNEFNVSYKVIGATSNVLFKDEVVYSCFLSTTKLLGLDYLEANQKLIVGSGVMLPDFSRYALFNGITGFEGLEGIPGTMGGAVFMNAGAYGCEIKDYLKEVELVDHEGNLKSYDVKSLELGKRTSSLKKGIINGVVTNCVFLACKGDVEDIEKKMELFHAKRHKYQDFLYPNLGSMYSGSPYRELSKKDKLFGFISAFYYLWNYKLKLFRRESPINRKWLNDIVVKRFNLNYDTQPFSNKTLNCLVNRGQGSAEMIRFINEIGKLTNNNIPVENEIIDEF